MPERTEPLGPYLLLRKIGAGGMGEVHLARDPRLDREVALKLLPADLRDDPERRHRFLREARAVAKLSHPNITAIHEVGEAEGRDYIAFEYVEGKTLEALVGERALTLVELIDLALPLADALAYAHERGVIHRDLKAANVMVTSRGHAKLLDFGLAKLLQEEGVERKRKNTTLTMEGAIFGTPQAMSPEQALGRAVDERSDVFSFGSLLYEMASGKAAFRGETVMEVMDAVIHADPDELARLRPDLPEEFAAIVAKAMRKEPTERYPSIAGLVADLKHFKRKTESGLVPVALARRPVLPAVLLGIVGLVAALAWILAGRDGREGGNSAAPAATARDSIAVMGFEWVGGSRDADGSSLDRALTSLVTTALAEAGGLDVTSSSKVVACLRRAGQSVGSAFDPGLAAEAALAAGVDVMLVGQVLKRPGGLVLTAELVDVTSGNALDSLRREVASEEDLFALAEGLAADVREHLGVAEEGRARIDLEGGLTDAPEAYYKFVAGEMAMHEARFADARRLLGQAIEIDPSFAFAYLRLGMATEWEGDPAAAEATYAQALEHSARLPERWQRMVQVFLDYNRGNQQEALDEVQGLITEGHALPEAYNVLGEILTHSTCHEDPARARDAFLQALEIDPNFQIVLYHTVGLSIRIDQPEVIENLLERLRREGANPEGLGYLEMGLALARRDAAAGASRIESAGREVEDLEEYVWCLTELGRLAEAEAVTASQTPSAGSNGLRNKLQFQGEVAFHLGRIREALRFYESASESMLAPEGNAILWYASNLADAKIQAASIWFLLGSLDEACARLDEAGRLDVYAVEPLFWKTRWLIDAQRSEDAARALARMRSIAAACTSPISAAWLTLAEIELALAEGDLARAQERLANFEPTSFAARPRCETELVRARVMRAAGDDQGELQAWRSALHAARGIMASGPTLLLPALYGLADAEERAGETDAAHQHGQELLATWGECEEDLAILADARLRWGR